MYLLKTFFIFFVLVAIVDKSISISYLKADGQTNTYQLIQTVFGGPSSAVETPDCNHTSFGPHITQIRDTTLNTFVFAFHSHIKQDDDRCIKFDRQRIEIKTNDNVPADQLTGHLGDFLSLSWDFKLDAGFLPPYSFCHVHQLKAVDGDDSMPIITLTPRRSHPENLLQVIHMDSKGGYDIVKMVPLQPWLGEWVHITSNATFKTEGGTYNVEVKRRSDGEILLSYNSANIDMWRNSTSYVRPKWGIYRSVQEAAVSRNETVLFHNFCVSKGLQNICP